jgi:hypothetical protein
MAPAWSEKKIVRFFRFAATRAVCVPVKIELYNWGGRNFANFDDNWASSSFFSISSICVRLSSINPAEDDNHRQENDQSAEIAMERAHELHCFLRGRNSGKDVHGREISKIKHTDDQQS